jgi:hypothetical protein
MISSSATDRVPDAVGPHDPVSFEHPEMLGEQRRFDSRRGQDLADPGGARVGREDLQDPDPGGVGQGFEEVRLDLVQRAFAAAGGDVGHGHSELVDSWIEQLLNPKSSRSANYRLASDGDREGVPAID